MRMIVIGAGPKAAAISAKAAVLRVLGETVPDICVVDAHGWAAHWEGKLGFTDGKQQLGTPPEKDVGFPYQSHWGAAVDRLMLEYSWQGYKIEQGDYADWVDRSKPQPRHGEWAEYLKWVAAKANVAIKNERVTGVDVRGERWILSCQSGRELEAEVVVVTGPGPAKQLRGQPTSHRRIFDGQDFWLRLDEVEKIEKHATVGVVGSGETAGAIVAELIRRLHLRHVAVSIINHTGMLFSRGESFHESRFFTQTPDEWQKWSLGERRTDR